MSRKANIVCIVICLVVILAVIGAIIYTQMRTFTARAKPIKPPLRKWHTSFSECRRTKTSSPVIAITLNLLTSPAVILPMNFSGWIGGERDRNVLRHAPRSYRTL